MRAASLLLWLPYFLWTSSNALLVEDAGKLDFLVATSGHGPIVQVVAVDKYMISTGRNCYVACRNVATGSLVWRRNVCLIDNNDNEDSTTSVSIQKLDETFVQTFDGRVARTWNIETGSLQDDSVSDKLPKPQTPLSTSVTCNKQTLTVQDLPAPADHVFLLTCHENYSILLSTCNKGTTTVYKTNGPNGSLQKLWTQEESLAFVKSAFFYDASHELDDSSNTHDLLTVSNRLALQMRALQTRETTVQHFGFVKLAIVQTEVRVYAIETVGEQRGWIRWTVDLDAHAQWNKMIHGTYTSQVNSHGAAHTKEILLLSHKDDTLRFEVIDGSTGKIVATGTHQGISNKAVQWVPIVSEGKQTVLVVYEKEEGYINVRGDVSIPERLYVHTLVGQQLNSISIHGSFSLLVGSTTFANEEIATVAYPNREEVVNSPCAVLGDNSLLLKYLNPHLVVVVTLGPSDATVEIPPKTKPANRKPAGVDGASWAEPDVPPNLFVNVVDTVSGRILYRASHSHAASSPKPQAVISENWVFYSFVNTKTRKAELGVLSLYEGMIDKKELTAFSTPEQATTFSSLNARETTPVVLAKTYVIPKAVVSMGVTSTRGGIATRKLLLAGLDGQIHAVDRKVLEPRRPMGALKDHEKKEGLVQYHELVPLVSFASLAYNQTVEGVTTIISAPTDLESQSLILAFGGPDIYFTRTAPSRGFDLLPDTFNKPLLSVVVGVLVVALLVMKRMVAKKIQRQGWV